MQGKDGSLTLHTLCTSYYQIDWFESGALQNGLLLSQGMGLNLSYGKKHHWLVGRGAKGGSLTVQTVCTSYYQIDWIERRALQNGLLLSQVIGLTQILWEKTSLECWLSLKRE